MSALPLIACVALTGALLASAGDRAPGIPRPGRDGLPVHVSAAPGMPEFAIFGWVSPPAESTTDARVAEMAGAGMNLALPAPPDAGRILDNLKRLEYAAAHGLRCIIWDHRFERFLTLGVESPEGGALIDSIVADYRDRPAFAGYYLGDEPPADEFPLLGELHAALRARDPGHPAWNNLYGPPAAGVDAAWRGLVAEYLDRTHAAVLCDDEYVFLKTGDIPRFVENVATLSVMARGRGIPFWTIVLLTQHGPYRSPSDGEMRWQVSHLLAYGARGVGYFTYWTPAPDSLFNWQPAVIGPDGMRTHWFDFLARWNVRVKHAGEVLAKLDWFGTSHAGSVPPGAVAFAPDAWAAGVRGRAALGAFADAAGTRYLLVANSDSAAAQTIGLDLPLADRVDTLCAADGSWRSLGAAGAASASRAAPGARAVLDLAAGDFALLRIAGSFSVGGAGAPLVLGLSPNPARGEVLIVTAQCGPRARVAVLDASGRRVWGRALGAGSASVTWRGERDRGGVAAPGVYFARAEDARGARTVRFSWLGR